MRSAPCEQALGAELVLIAGLGPHIRGVDRRVAVHVGAVLVGKPVHTEALQRLKLIETGPQTT